MFLPERRPVNRSHGGARPGLSTKRNHRRGDASRSASVPELRWPRRSGRDQSGRGGNRGAAASAGPKGVLVRRSPSVRSEIAACVVMKAANAARPRSRPPTVACPRPSPPSMPGRKSPKPCRRSASTPIAGSQHLPRPPWLCHPPCHPERHRRWGRRRRAAMTSSTARASAVRSRS